MSVKKNSVAGAYAGGSHGTVRLQNLGCDL